MDLVYDEKIGWYDPSIAYCADSCGNMATVEHLKEIVEPAVLTGHPYDFTELVYLLCEDCKNTRLTRSV